MKSRVTDEMLDFAVLTCKKYSQVRTLAEEAETSWKQNLEMVAASKYPGEKEMYEQQAEEDLARYTAAREWLKLVDGAVGKVRDEKSRLVLKQNCLGGATMKSVLVDKKSGTYMSRSTATRYKKKGITELAVQLEKVKKPLEEKNEKMSRFGAE